MPSYRGPWQTPTESQEHVPRHPKQLRTPRLASSQNARCPVAGCQLGGGRHPSVVAVGAAKTGTTFFDIVIAVDPSRPKRCQVAGRECLGPQEGCDGRRTTKDRGHELAISSLLAPMTLLEGLKSTPYHTGWPQEEGTVQPPKPRCRKQTTCSGLIHHSTPVLRCLSGEDECWGQGGHPTSLTGAECGRLCPLHSTLKPWWSLWHFPNFWTRVQFCQPVPPERNFFQILTSFTVLVASAPVIARNWLRWKLHIGLRWHGSCHLCAPCATLVLLW